MDPIYEKLTEILERTARVETKVDNLTEEHKSIEEVRKMSFDAQSRARSAHKRLDKIDKIIFWLATTVIGAVILSVLGLIFIKEG